MAQDIKLLRNAGMDSDSSVEFIAQEDILEAYNLRVSGSVELEEGDGSNIESTVLIAGTRATGINKGIGAQGFEIIRAGISFVYNSQLFHVISYLDYDSNVQTNIFTNKTQSGGNNILNLNPRFFVTDIKIVNDTFLLFTDNFNQPGYINFRQLIAGDYGTLTSNDFLLIQAQPLVVPTAEYNNDASRSVNLLRTNLFQFIEQFVKINDEYTAWSIMSKRPVPTDETTPAVGTNVAIDNNIIVGVTAGDNRVKTINVGARIGTLDFMLIKSISRAEVLLIPNTAIDIANEIREAYDPTTNMYYFCFYNDGLYPNIDPIETDLPYDYVPRKAGTLEILPSNVVVMGDITEGYPRPETDVTLQVVSYEPDIAIVPPDPATTFKVDTWYQYRPSGESFRRVTVVFSGNPETGDVVTIITSNLDDVVYNTISYTVPITQDGDLLAVVQSLAAIMPYPTGVTQRFDGTVVLEFSTRRESETPDGGREKMLNYTIVLSGAGTGASRSIPGLKSNSSYQVFLWHKDKWGRYFPISTDIRYVIKTPSFSQLQGLASKIVWQINDATAPDDAVVYGWGLSPNNTHQTDLWVTGILDVALSTSDYFVFNINPLLRFNTANSSSVLTYDYSVGDRCTFLFYNPGDNTAITNWIDKVDVEVVGFDIDVVVTPSPATNYYLKVRKPSTISAATLTGNNIMLEVYTPRKRAEDVDGVTEYNPTVFFETGIQYPIVNGEYSVLQGEITDGDTYIKSRQMVNGADLNQLDSWVVEDFNFSDFYPSMYTSYGKPRTYDDEIGEVRKKASIRYSDTFILGSKINGLTRFYGERIYGEGDGESSSNYDQIDKLVVRNNTLICIQGLKVGYIPVFGTIVEDQASQEQYALSDRILNKIRYNTSGNIGMGGAKESFAMYNNNLYFIDPYRSEPVRAGLDGVEPISGKMSKYFKRVYQEAYEAGKKVIGNYNIFNNEYTPSIETEGDIVEVFPFTTQYWQLEDTYTIPAGDITLTTQGTKSVTTYNSSTGIATFTPDTGDTGLDNFTFSFTPSGGVLTTKRACVTIEEGTTTINPIIFAPIVGAELSTLMVSNSQLIIGNDIPVAVTVEAGMEYRINGDEGTWVSTPGTVNEYDSIEVRQTSSASYDTETVYDLTVSGDVSGFSVTTKDQEPDPFTFVDITGADLSTLYVSNSVTITGITGSIPISIVDGEYSIGAGAFTSVTGTITNGQTVRVRRTSSASYLTTVGTTLTVGSGSDTYSITTKPDLTPDPFTFTDITGAELSTLYISNLITISGLSGGYTTPVTISGAGEYSKNGGGYTSSAGTAENGDTFTVRQTSSASYSTAVNSTLTVGGISDTYTVTTKDDIIPDPFTFVDVTDAELSSVYNSNIVTITGINAPTAISIVDGEYRINGGTWVSTAGSISNGQTAQVRRTSSPSYSTAVGTTLTVGGISDTYTITTKSGTPTSFTFIDVIDKEVSTLYTSNTVIMAGYVGSLPVSIVDGQYQINGGSWVSTAGTITVGDSVAVRRTSSPSYSTTVGTTLTVGTYSDEYAITTRVAANVTVNYDMVWGADPTTNHWNVVERIRGGVTSTIATIANVTSGTLPAGDFKEGDTITVYQGAYLPFMWAPDSNVNLVLDVDAVEFYNGDVTSQSGTQDTGSYVIAPGVSVIDIISTGSSTAEDYSSFSLVSNSYIGDGEFTVDLSDNDEAGLGLDSLQPNNGTGVGYPFNVSDGAGDMTITITNNKATAIDYSIAGVGGYIEVGTIAGMGNVVHSDVPKGDVTVEVSDNNGAVACGIPVAYSGGQTYPSIQVITLGSGLGTVTLNFDAHTVPDKFIVVFDGVEVINTGYRGDTGQQAALDAALATYGAPPETITSPGNGTDNFVKGTATTTCTLYVYAPMSTTIWDADVSCPV